MKRFLSPHLTRRKFLLATSGIFIPTITGILKAQTPLTLRDPAFLGRRHVSGVTITNPIVEDFESYSLGSLSNGSTLTAGSGWNGAPTLNITGAASIISQTFSEGAKKGLSLANGEYIRKMAISNDWSVLRIGVLWAQTPNGVSSLPDSITTLGVNSGISFGYGGGANTVNYAGLEPIGRSFIGNLWHMSYGAGSGNPTFTGQGGKALFKKVGSTVTEILTQANPVTFVPSNNGSTQRKWAQFLQIAKGSPNYTLTWMYPCDSGTCGGSFAPATNHTTTDFDTALATVSTSPTVNGTIYSNANATASGAISEAAGIFDSFSIYNNLSTYPVEIYKIGIYKFS